TPSSFLHLPHSLSLRLADLFCSRHRTLVQNGTREQLFTQHVTDPADDTDTVAAAAAAAYVKLEASSKTWATCSRTQ
ncbi:hypothetical protein FB45DRAFT_1053489, partial [Roridomyces roridus]